MTTITPSQRKKVLLIAYIGSENLGDEAIFTSLAHDLSKADVELTATSRNSKKTEKFGVSAVKPYSPAFIKTLINSDAVLLGGGGLLQDQTSIYNLPYFVLQMLLARLLGKKTMLVAIGAGPVQGLFGKLLISLLLKTIDGATVRDRYSYNLLKKLGAGESTMHLVTDPAISLTGEKSGKPRDIPDEFIEENYVLVCLRHWFDLNRFLPVALSNKLNLSCRGKRSYDIFIKGFSRCLDAIVDDTSLRVIFFPFYGTRDIKVNRDAYQELKNRDKAFVIPAPQTLGAFQYLAGNAQLVISMRLHSAILSASQKTPNIALSYSIKVREFMKSLGMEEYTLDLNELNETRILTLVHKILQNKTQLYSEIIKSVAALQAVNRKNIEIILDFLRKTDCK